MGVRLAGLPRRGGSARAGEQQEGAVTERRGQGGGAARVEVELDAGLLERGHQLVRVRVGHAVADADRRVADVQERGADAYDVAGVERSGEAQAELERRVGATFLAAVRRGHAEGREHLLVGRGEAMDVRGHPGLAERVDLRRLQDVTRRVHEPVVAPERGGGRLSLRDRGHLDPPGLGRLPLLRVEGASRPRLPIEQGHPLLERRAHGVVGGVDHLVDEAEAVVLHVRDPAADVQDVTDAELPPVAHEAVHGHTGLAAALQRDRIEPEGVQQPVGGVLEPREVKRDREVIDLVHFPAVHRPPIRLEPAHRVHEGRILHDRARGADAHDEGGQETGLAVL